MHAATGKERAMARERSGKRTHRRDRVARWFLVVVVLLAVAGLCAPSIIGHTPLRNAALANALPAEAGELTASDASLGWFTPTLLHGVQLTDPNGQVLFRADTVAVDRSLWQLATNSNDLGVVTVDRPVLFVVARANGSNLEDLLAALDDEGTEPESPATGSIATQLQLQIKGGSVAVNDTITGVTTIHDPINVDATLDGSLQTAQIAGSIGAASYPAGAPLPPLPFGRSNPSAGSFTASLAPNGAGANEAKFQLTSVDPAALAPWLRRLDRSLVVEGLLQGQGVATWWPQAEGASTLPQRIGSSGSFAARRLQVSSHTLGGDPVALGDFDASWRLSSAADGRLQIEQLGLKSDYATATASGLLTSGEISQLAAGDWLAPRSVQVSADLDLARLGRIAPELLHLRRGVTLTSGRVKVNATTQPDGVGRRITGAVNTADLVAQANGREVRWQKPISLRLAAREFPGRLEIAQLDCRSSFLNGSVKGDLNDLRAKADLDLDRLVAEAKQLFDFGPWRMSGRAEGNARLLRGGNNQFRATVQGNVSGCVVTYGDRPIVQERELSLEVAATGQTDPKTQRPATIATGSLAIVAAGDQLQAQLTGPTTLVAKDYPLDVRLVGDVRAWLRRAKFLLSEAGDDSDLLATLRASGVVDARLVGRVGAQNATLTTTSLVATNLTATTGQLRINEPKVEVSGDLVWDGATGSLASRQGRLVSSTLAAQARDLAWRDAAATGSLAVRADLARLSASVPAMLGATRVDGQASGGVRLVSQPGGPAAELNLTCQPFAVSEVQAGAAPSVLWQEPALGVRGVVAHETRGDRLVITGLAIQSNNLSATANGNVANLSTEPTATINAAIDYDLAELTPLIANRLGPGVRLVGRHQASVQLATAAASPNTEPAHWSRRLTGRVSAPWTSASLFGLTMGSGTVNATVSNGVVQFDPLAVSVGQGRLTIQPAARLDPPPAEWGLPAGQIIENVRISPEVSDQMLKFIAPVLADATRSEGTFSVRTEGMRAALDDPTTLETSGQLAVRNLRVTPGPGVANWVSVARQVEALAKDRDPTALASRPAPTLLSIADRTINFQVTGRRVHHQGLTFDVDGVPVTSAGSVGFDETLQLTLNVPIQDRWIEKDRRLVGLQGQVVQVPIGGTLSRPRVDGRALQALSRDLIQKGVQGAIQNEIGRALEKLFE